MICHGTVSIRHATKGTVYRDPSAHGLDGPRPTSSLITRTNHSSDSPLPRSSISNHCKCNRESVSPGRERSKALLRAPLPSRRISCIVKRPGSFPKQATRDYDTAYSNGELSFLHIPFSHHPNPSKHHFRCPTLTKLPPSCHNGSAKVRLRSEHIPSDPPTSRVELPHEESGPRDVQARPPRRLASPSGTNYTYHLHSVCAPEHCPWQSTRDPHTRSILLPACPASPLLTTVDLSAKRRFSRHRLGSIDSTLDTHARELRCDYEDSEEDHGHIDASQDVYTGRRKRKT